MTLAEQTLTTSSQPDDSAFEKTFLENFGPVFGVVYRIVGDEAAAEDITLDVFVQLWRNPPPHRQNIAGWLYRVGTRLALNTLRAARRRSQYEETAGRVLVEQAEPVHPEQAAQNAEARAITRRALASLSPREAQLLLMRHSGFSYQQIADALDITAGSVGTLLARAEVRFEKAYLALEGHLP